MRAQERQQTGGWRRIAGAAGLAVLVALAGCASLVPPPAGVPSAWMATSSPEALRCGKWLEALDAATASAHVRDGAAHQIPGFAWLRVDRFLASFRADVSASGTAVPAPFAAWLTRLEALDVQGRSAELANLPDQAVPEGLAKPAAALRTQACRTHLSSAVAQSPALRQQLMDRAQVPDDYQDWKRALGLYPLTRLPFFAGVQNWQSGLQARFDAGSVSPQAGTWQRYVPQAQPLEPAEVAAVLAAMHHDALGVPRPDATQEQRLLDAYAPVLAVETKGAFDRFGGLRWGTGPAPDVLTDVPLAYRRMAWTRHGSAVLPQLVYSFWFPARPPAGGFDVLAGRLDALVLRVTLASDGTPLMVDSIHACGCYHLFFPVGAVTPRPAPVPDEEWAFVPKTLAAMRPGQRVAVQIESGTHYLVGIRPDTGESGATYAAESDDALRSLPVSAGDQSGGGAGSTRSAFWPSGIVAGTERGERVLFWPMGIDSPGAMRQWGRQPTAFVGRRHFDDARLLEERFNLTLP